MAYSLIHLSGWSGEPLLDPMCGTGTILIEAALLYNNISPAKHRDDFAFKNLSFFNRYEYLSVKNEFLENEINKPLTLMGFDNSPNSIAEAKQNSRKAGISHLTTFGLSDVEGIEPERKPYFIISNPPFGLRLKDPDSVSNIAIKFWNRISEFGDVSVMIISGNKEFENKAPCDSLWHREVYLGGLVCRVLKYRL